MPLEESRPLAQASYFFDIQWNRGIKFLTARNIVQMSQVLRRGCNPSRPQAREIAEAVGHKTRQAGLRSSATLVETGPRGTQNG